MNTLILTFQGKEIGSVSISDKALQDIVTASAMLRKQPTASLDVKSIKSAHRATVLDISFPCATYESFGG